MSEFDGLMAIDNVLEQDQKHRQAFLYLLDRQQERKDHLFSIEVRMGVTRSFITSASLAWTAQQVRYATQLPMFKEYVDPDTSKVKIDRETAAMVQQREPNWTRQYPMTLYLAKRKRHKFPPLLLVATQSWVDDPKSDSWDSAGRALKDSINAQSLDSNGIYVDLSFSVDNLLYAIDGQHRLMAIKGLAELVNEGKLYARDRDNKQTKLSVSAEQIVDDSNGNISRAELQAVLSERIGIEIIPAVMKGESRQDALRRIRSIFVHVNMNAQPLTSGELAVLDEDDGFAVVARTIAFSHPLLIDRVELKKGNLAPSSDNFTTLESLVSIAENYLGQMEGYQGWKPDTKTQMAMRPEEESIDLGHKKLVEYFDSLAKLPTHVRVIQQGNDYVKAARENEHNLLFRPMAQMALAEAFGTLVTDRQRKIENMIQVLSAKEAEGMLNYENPKTPWYVVVFDPNKKTMERKASAQKLVSRLFIHLLGGGTSDDAAYRELKAEFGKARIVDKDSGKAIDLNGNSVPIDQVELPTPWV